MNKNAKTPNTQISTTRRKVLKKLSYSPPLLMCLGTLTKPRMAGASHNGPLLDTQGWSNTPEGMNVVERVIFGGEPAGIIAAEYAAYQEAYNAEHGL